MPRLASLRVPSLLPLPTLVLVLWAALALAPSAAAGDVVVDEHVLADGLGGFTQGGIPNYANSYLGAAACGLGDVDGDGVADLAVGQTEVALASTGRVYTLLLKADGTVKSQVEIASGKGGFVGPLTNSDLFGYDLAALGDVDGDGHGDLAVGAPFDDDGIPNAGAVWVLFLDGTGAVRGEQKLSNLAGTLGFSLDLSDQFGTSVEGLGDLNGDGVPDLVVGAAEDDDGGTNRGALYVLFLRVDGTVASHQKISQTSGLLVGALDDHGRFGSALAELGDVDGDGFPELAVGQEGGLVGTEDKGSVWLLSLFTNGLVLRAFVLEEGTRGFDDVCADGERFGASVVALGDLNGDGVVDLAVGSPLANAPSGGLDQGIVRILYLTETLTCLGFDRIGLGEGGFGGALATSDRFGVSVAALGDLRADGTLELVVGADGDDRTASSAGALHVLSLEFCRTQASVTTRNAGTNPNSYVAPPPVLGQPWVATVDTSLTGHTFAGIAAFTHAFQFTLPGGQTLLVIDASGAGELLQLGAQAGPQASFLVDVPLDSALCGFFTATQAFHFGGGQGFRLTNAQDLVLGHQ